MQEIGAGLQQIPEGLPPSEIAAIIAAILASSDKHSVLLEGPPGVGKTAVIKQAAKTAGQATVFTDLGTADPTNANGYCWVVEGKAVFLPFGDIRRLMETTDPIVWVWDDLGWAPDSVQKAFAHGLDEGRFGDIELGKNVTVLAATNRRGDKAGVTGILEPVKSRFTTILPFKAFFPDFKAWWVTQDLPLEPLAFLMQQPLYLHDWKATKDLVNQPCPRTWEAAGKIVKLGLPDDLELSALNGTIGKAAAGAYHQAIRDMRESIDLEGIIRDPDNAEIPDEGRISALFAISNGLAHMVTVKNFGNVCRYMERLADADHVEFASLLLQNCIRKNVNLCSTRAYVELVKTGSKLGDVLGNLRAA